MDMQSIFETAPQSVMDLGQPIQNAIGFPATLAERYEPRRLSDFIGIERPKKMLAALVAAPRPAKMLFIGPPGSGKTAIGMAFAEELGGSLVHLAAQKCDVAAIESLKDRLAYTPKGGWWVVLTDEADQMTDKAQTAFLSLLDSTASLKPVFGGGMERGTPPPVIWIFTLNGNGPDGTGVPSSLLPRFQSRNFIVEFEAAKISDLAAHLERIWKLEGGEATVEGYFDYIADGVGVRDAMMRLETDLLAGPRTLPKVIVAGDPVVAPAIAPARCKSRTASTQDAIRSAAANKAWATRRARAAAGL